MNSDASPRPIEDRVARLRELSGLSEERAREAVNNDQRERLLSQDIVIGGALSLAALVPDTLFVCEPAFVQGQLITITGPNGAGKTTFASGCACALALQRSFGMLRPARAGLVYFVSAEDIAGTRLRFYAEAVRHKLSAHEQADIDGRLRWVHINSRKHPTLIAEAIQNDAGANNIVAVFVDTGPALFVGDNENDNAQLQTYAEAWRRCTELPGAPCVALLWHPAKGATADNLLPRGGSSLIGTVDANLTVWRDDDSFIVGFTKLRSEHFEPMRFALESIPLILPSGAHVSIPIAVPVIDDRARDDAARDRREQLLMALAGCTNGNLLSVRDLAEATGQSKSAIGRQLKTMLHSRPPLIEQDPLSERYRPTKAGQAAASAVRLKSAAAYRNASDPG